MRTRLERFFALIVAGLLLHAPAIAHACSVCMAGKDEENNGAFLAMTIFMSITPLLMIGGLGFYLFRRFRAHERAQDEAEHARREGQASARGLAPVSAVRVRPNA